MKLSSIRWWQVSIFALLCGVFISRIWALTILPVFADEAIYIRWAQLIIDNPGRYALFAMNDGKTPLFIWMMTAMLQLPFDQLFLGRLVTVLASVIQVWLLVRITLAVGGSKLTAFLSGLLGFFIPFWFFHQRLAIMDVWLTVWCSLTVLSVLELGKISDSIAVQKKGLLEQLLKNFRSKQFARWILVAGVAIGVAFYTKLPTVLILPSLAVLPFLEKRLWRRVIIIWAGTAVSIAIGIGIFLSLALHPSFGQLFSRGGDFLYSPLEVFQTDGLWRSILAQSRRLMHELFEYYGIAVALAIVVGVSIPKTRRKMLSLLLAGTIFMLPVFVLGQVVYLRYLLPAAIFFTVAGGLSLGQMWQINGSGKILFRSLAILLVLQIVVTGFLFMHTSYTNPDQIPLPQSDRVQYLTEWSSGHGVEAVTRKLLEESSPDNRIYLATEGYFGTLPDGILLYLHQEDTAYLHVEGIGQPVEGFSDQLVAHAAVYDQVWLVVNSHRMNVELNQDMLILEYCRPDNAPCLQLWDISAEVLPSD